MRVEIPSEERAQALKERGVTCPLCGKRLFCISHAHLRVSHDMTVKEFKERFPDVKRSSGRTAEQRRQASAGVRGYNQAHPEEVVERNVRARATQAAWSEERQATFIKNCSKAQTKRHSCLTPEEEAAVGRRMSETKQNWSPKKRVEVGVIYSRAASKAILEGGLRSGTYGKKGYHCSGKCPEGKIYYQSSYEFAAYKLLDQLSEVKSYQRPPTAIPYMHPKKNHVCLYHPDVLVQYLSGRSDLIEIKAEWQLQHIATSAVNKAKFEAAREWCDRQGIQFQVWTESDLGLGGTA